MLAALPGVAFVLLGAEAFVEFFFLTFVAFVPVACDDATFSCADAPVRAVLPPVEVADALAFAPGVALVVVCFALATPGLPVVPDAAAEAEATLVVPADVVPLDDDCVAAVVAVELTAVPPPAEELARESVDDEALTVALELDWPDPPALETVVERIELELDELLELDEFVVPEELLELLELLDRVFVVEFIEIEPPAEPGELEPGDDVPGCPGVPGSPATAMPCARSIATSASGSARRARGKRVTSRRGGASGEA